MKPFISVIIPLYNKEHFITVTLQSVLKQTFVNYEIIIVNDGSTDNSLSIVKNLTKTLKNCTIVSQENKGLSATRNKAISLANGTIIALLDADDAWHNTFLSEIVDLYTKFPEASLYGTDYLEKYSDKNTLEIRKNLDLNLKGQSFIVDDFFKANLFQPIISQSNFAFRRDVFKTVKYNETIDFGEDIEFYIKSGLQYTLAYAYKALATIHFNVPNQITDIGYKGKRLPNFDAFEADAKTNLSLKLFLDYNRYYLLIKTKITNDKENYNLLKKHLEVNNLTFKQQILLKIPVSGLRFARWIKKFFLKQNIRLTSY